MKQAVFLLLIISCCGSYSAFGQYHLTEVGVLAGGGLALPAGAAELGPSFGLGGNVFFSHYVCGKRFGYHGAVGIQTLNAVVSQTLVLNPLTFSSGDRMMFTYADAGFYFKVRRHEFHSAKEVALLVGPKVAVKTFALRTISENTAAFTNGDDFKLSPVLPGLHLSLFARQKLGKTTLFLAPGIDYYFLPALTADPQTMFFLYPHFNLGIALWDSKRNKFRNN